MERAIAKRNPGKRKRGYLETNSKTLPAIERVKDTR
jgi:hypothetical protein